MPDTFTIAVLSGTLVVLILLMKIKAPFLVYDEGFAVFNAVRVMEGDVPHRDFWAIYECEHCGAIEKDVASYDDSYFHDSVIPKMKCKACGEIGKDYVPLSPKYDDSEVI